ncbi:histidine phosphatase family protein [Pseudomonadota bacterium]
MLTELLILRHGKSDWSVAVDDFHRPLKDRGKRGAQRMGLYLWQQGLLPDHIVSSPAERALVTAEKTCKAMGMGTLNIRCDQRIYAAELESLLTVLGDCPLNANRVMLVGHNPGLEDLLLHLSATQIPLPDNGKLLPTASLAHLSMPKDWKLLPAHSAHLLSITRPHELPKMFSYPAPNGKQLRERPAYYYEQSSVIPYRLNQGELEILVIQSSKKKHYVVPKGIKEPGLSARESAAQEAFEEAGVEGLVNDDPIGSYVYEKWGAECTVAVYPMQVTREIPEQEWEENHRGRQWVSPRQAVERLKQPDLAQFVTELARQLRA